MSPGGAAYVPKFHLSTKDAIAAIRDAGGISSLAHPGVSDVDAKIPQLVREGLQCAGQPGALETRDGGLRLVTSQGENGSEQLHRGGLELVRVALEKCVCFRVVAQAHVQAEARAQGVEIAMGRCRIVPRGGRNGLEMLQRQREFALGFEEPGGVCCCLRGTHLQRQAAKQQWRQERDTCPE